MGGIEQWNVPKPTERALRAVRQQDSVAEWSLVQSHAEDHFRVSPNWIEWLARQCS
jgi:hypothetical protein